MSSGAAFLKGKAAPPTDDPSEESDGLRGLPRIAAFAQYGVNTVKRMIENESFPAIMVEGAWESSKRLIDEWRIRRIRDAMAQAATDDAV